MPVIDHRAGEDRIIVRCAFEDNATIKTISGRAFNSALRAWTIPATIDAIAAIKDRFPGRLAATPAARRLVESITAEHQRQLGAREAEDATITAPWADRLFPFQRAGVSYLTIAKRAILADDMGLGKTLQALTAVHEEGAFPLLVVCQSTCKIDPWRKEIRAWLGDAPTVEVLGIRGSRTKKQRLAAMERKPDILIINYESARGHEAELMARDWGAVIVDEAHLIKNQKAQQSRVVLAVAAKTERLFLLTGTPILNRAQEIWTQLHAINPTRFARYWDFVFAHFETHRNGYGTVVGGLKDEAAFRELLKPHFLRRTKTEVLPDMPSKMTVRRVLEMSDVQAAMHRQMANDWEVTTAAGPVTANIVLTQLGYLRQIAASPRLLDPEADAGPKIEAIAELLDSTDDKVVVFSQYKKTLDAMAEVLNERGIGHVRIDGDVDQDERPVLIERFQQDQDTRVFLGTIQAAGHGVTLTAAATVVFIDRHWTPGVNNQAADRVHRIGQTRPVTVIELSVEDSIDEWLEDLLATKAAVFAALFGGANQGAANEIAEELTRFMARWRHKRRL